MGTSNMGAIHKDIDATTAKVASLNAAMKGAQNNIAGSGRNTALPDTRWLRQYNYQMQGHRESLNQSVMAMDNFRVRNVRVADSVDLLTERINNGKLSFRGFMRELKSGGIRDVIREQMALRKSMVMEWGKDGYGVTNADIYIPPRHGIKMWQDWRVAAGGYNHILGQVSEATINWGKNTQWAGRQITAGFTMPFLLAAAATTKFAYEIDKGLTQIIKVYGDADSAISDAQITENAMRSAREMASQFGQSANDTLEIQGQLAAVGKEGQELQEATVEVTRARLLGEIDLQDAMKSTITLQSVWNMSSKELAESFNYMNSMENQTVLTMQDFVEGIPKVAGIIKDLNGDVREAGTLLLALKAGGIEAAEGATAIKSIAFKVMAPTNAALNQFQQATGRTWAEVMKGSESVLQRLQLFGEAIQDLGMEERVSLIQRLFGLHQGSKALTIISQLASGSEQMARAFEVASQSSQEWADTAAYELDKLTKSDWNRIQQEIQTLKVTLAEVGQTFLGAVAPILGFFNKFFEFFNGLSDRTKKWTIALFALLAAAGPFLMFLGIAGNLIGNMGKGMSNLLGIYLKWGGMLNAEDAARMKLAAKVKGSIDATYNEAAAYRQLAQQMQIVTDAMTRQMQLRDQAIADAGKNSMVTTVVGGAPTGTRRRATSPAGNPADLIQTKTLSRGARRATSPAGNPSALRAAQAGGVYGTMYDPAVFISAPKQVNAVKEGLAEADDKVKSMGINAKLFGATMLAGTVAAVAGTDSLVGRMSQVLTMATSVALAMNTIAPAMTAGIGKGVGNITTSLFGKITASKAGVAATSAFTGMKTGLATMLPALGSVVTGIGAIGVAAGAAWWILNKNVKESRKEMEAFNNSAQTYANVIGFAYKEVGEAINEAGEKVKGVNQIMKEMNEESPDLVEQLRKYSDFGLAFHMQTAIGEGLKAMQHGANEEEAKRAATAAWRIMDSTMSEASIALQIEPYFNFDDSDAAFRNLSSTITYRLREAAHADFNRGKSETFLKFLGFGGGLDSITEEARTMARGFGDSFYTEWANAAEEDRPGVADKIFKAMEANREIQFLSLRNHYVSQFRQLGIDSAEEFSEWLKKAPRIAFEGMTAEQAEAMMMYQEFSPEHIQMFTREQELLNEMIRGFAVSILGIPREELDRLYSTNQLRKYVTDQERVSLAQKNYGQHLTRAFAANANLSESEQLRILNIYRLEAGLERATSIAQGFSAKIAQAGRNAANAWAEIGSGYNIFSSGGIASMREGLTIGNMGFTDETVQDFVNEYKQIYQDAQSGVINAASMVAGWADQDAQSALQRGFDAARENLERNQERAQKGLEAQHERQQKAMEARSEALDKAQEKRREAMEGRYDKQVEGIQNVIDKEKEIEDLRQKVFEAEKKRLSRLAEMKNMNIDFNVALNTGEFDKAAKLSNDIVAQNDAWNLEDSDLDARSAFEKRQDQLKDKIDVLNEEKKVALDNLKEVEEAEKKAQQNREELLKKRHQSETEALRKSQQAQNKALQEEQRAKQDSMRRQQEIRKAALDLELSTIRAAVPRNTAEMNQQIKQIEEAYARYGVDLKRQGGEWSKAVGDSLVRHIDNANVRITNGSNWQDMGRVIAENMALGGFGMTLTEFIKWVSTGEMPPKLRTIGKINGRTVKMDPKTGVHSIINANGNVTNQFWHSGGTVGKGSGRRTGISGALSQSEVPIVAQVGEGILNRRAMNYLGSDFIDHFNEGGHLNNSKYGIGGPDFTGPGFPQVSHMGSMLAAAAQGLRAGMKTIAKRRQQAGSGNMIPVGSGSAILYPGGWHRPAAGRRTSAYGMRQNPITGAWRMHAGSDIGAPMGAPIYAARGGKVTFVGYSGGRGNLTYIDHGAGIQTAYAHQSRFGVSQGQSVRTGQVIGYVGSTGNSTGPHLHFEYYKNGKHYNPNTIIPGLRNGGFTMSDGLAYLHKKETVLTAPLSEKLNQGIERIAEDNTSLVLDMRGANFYGVDDLEKAMDDIMERKERKIGRRRVIK